MLELSRRVRFGLRPGELGDRRAAGPAEQWGIGVFYELEVSCRGEPDGATGYLMNISVIDEAVRRHAVPVLADAMTAWIAGGGPPPGLVLADVIRALQPPLGATVASVRWWLSPYHWLQTESRRMDRVQISHQFEFAAAHRLHSDELSAEENRSVFGKCNNPSGHGHNYRLEAAVSVPLDDDTRFGFDELRRLVDEEVIERFDHKHLNLDTKEFAGLNPSVEHIARVCHGVLDGPVAEAGATLEYVTVWETEKTACTYPARQDRDDRP